MDDSYEQSADYKEDKSVITNLYDYNKSPATRKKTWPMESGKVVQHLTSQRRPVNAPDPRQKRFQCTEPGCGLRYYKGRELYRHQRIKGHKGIHKHDV